MSEFAKGNIINNLIRLAPLIVLFIAVLNESDLNYLEIFSLNFPFILVFYWSLKKNDSLSYGFIFIAGLFNDAVIGLPIGLSSLSYLLVCGFAAYSFHIANGWSAVPSALGYLPCAVVRPPWPAPVPPPQGGLPL